GVTVHFDPDQATVDSLGAAIKRLAAKRPKVEVPGRLHRIPVVYDGEDLDEVTRSLNLSRDELIAMHTRPIYRVFLVGFVPGWAYLGPLPEELYLPRRKASRMQRRTCSPATNAVRPPSSALSAARTWWRCARAWWPSPAQTSGRRSTAARRRCGPGSFWPPATG